MGIHSGGSYQASASKPSQQESYELYPKRLEGGYVGDYIGDYHRGYEGWHILEVEAIAHIREIPGDQIG